MFKIFELYTNKEYHEYDNQRIYVYVDIDDEKIIGADRKKLEPVIDEYISHNYRKLISPMLQQKDLIGGKKKFTPADAVKFHKDRILKYYLN